MAKIKTEGSEEDERLGAVKRDLDLALGERSKDYWDKFVLFTQYKVSKQDLDTFARGVLGDDNCMLLNFVL